MAYYKCGRIYTTQNSNVVVDTASGALANFETPLAMPLKSLEIDVNAVQDLHGYDAPWVGGAGKNKLRNDLTTKTVNNVTFTVNNEGSFVISGTPNTAVTEVTLNSDLGLPLGTYKVSGCSYGDTKVRLQIKKGGITLVQQYNNTDASFTVDDNSTYSIAIVVINTATLTGGVTVKPMIRLASVTDASFAPYSNICPISGWNAITLDVNGNTEVINLGGTYYGGHFTQDKAGHRQFVVTHGYGQITKATNKSGTWDTSTGKGAFWFNTYAGGITWLRLWDNSATNNGIVCDTLPLDNHVTTYDTDSGISIYSNEIIRWIDVEKMTLSLADYNTYLAEHPINICYPLKTPIIIDLPDGEPIKSFAGINNIYADTGDISLQFRKIG